MHEEIKEKRSSPHYLPPIHIHPAINLNPEHSRVFKKNVESSMPNPRRALSVHANYTTDFDQLR